MSVSVQMNLSNVIGQLQRQRYNLHVAVIRSIQDMGSIGVLYGSPGQYAKFLYKELSGALGPFPLLVVMPQGVGVAGATGPVKPNQLPSVPASAGHDPSQLAIAATNAAARIGRLQGRTVRVPPPPSRARIVAELRASGADPNAAVSVPHVNTGDGGPGRNAAAERPLSAATGGESGSAGQGPAARTPTPFAAPQAARRSNASGTGIAWLAPPLAIALAGVVAATLARRARRRAGVS
jgi:hypothetical protein